MEGSFKKTVCARFRSSHITGADFSRFQLESRTKCGHRSIGGGEGTKKRSLSREPVFLGGRLEKVPPLVIFYTTEEALLIVRPG